MTYTPREKQILRDFEKKHRSSIIEDKEIIPIYLHNVPEALITLLRKEREYAGRKMYRKGVKKGYGDAIEAEWGSK